MNRFQLENIYRANGLTDYRLQNTDDLLKVHGINFKAVDGYKGLDDLNKALYEKFIVNIFNAWGLESRATLIPKGIYFVEETTHAIKQSDEEGEYFLAVAGLVDSIDRNGFKKTIHVWKDDNFKAWEDKDLQIKSESETYLRFEYQHDGRDEWLHVMNEKEWY